MLCLNSEKIWYHGLRIINLICIFLLNQILKLFTFNFLIAFSIYQAEYCVYSMRTGGDEIKLERFNTGRDTH